MQIQICQNMLLSDFEHAAVRYFSVVAAGAPALVAECNFRIAIEHTFRRVDSRRLPIKIPEAYLPGLADGAVFHSIAVDPSHRHCTSLALILMVNSQKYVPCYIDLTFDEAATRIASVEILYGRVDIDLIPRSVIWRRRGETTSFPIIDIPGEDALWIWKVTSLSELDRAFFEQISSPA